MLNSRYYGNRFFHIPVGVVRDKYSDFWEETRHFIVVFCLFYAARVHRRPFFADNRKLLFMVL